ncbi:hypothetical protein TNCV_2907611 [Trichonephila clavipes]|nr:hypothetical protein TNCV_2907611 [Trichonephila clavipes]
MGYANQIRYLGERCKLAEKKVIEPAAVVTRHGTEGEGNNSQVPCNHDSAQKTFGPTDLTSTYFVCTRRVFGGLWHRTQTFRSGVRCSNY